MLYSILNNETICFISLHAECSLHIGSNEFFYDQKGKKEYWKMQGIYCTTVKAEILQNIFNEKYYDKDLCIDFSNIQEISRNNMIALINFVQSEFCSKEKKVYFVNVQKDIAEEVKQITSMGFVRENKDNSFISFPVKSENYNNVKLVDMYKKLFYAQLCDNISKCTVDLNGEEQKHFSVPVYLTRYINIKNMATSKSRFFCFCLYIVALKMIFSKIMSMDYEDNRNIKLFFHTMNGAFIAIQLGMLFHIDTVCFDHLGPIESVSRKHFEQRIKDGENFIIVSDVICLGGELSRAKTLVEYCGGSVKGQVCIVEICTVKKVNKGRVALYKITKENNYINYTIDTEFSRRDG